MNRSRRAARAGLVTAVAGAALGPMVMAAPSPAFQGEICELPPDPGPCDGVCPRWFFNSESGRCEEFVWGCCDGNANNFESLEECQAACPGVSCPADVDGDGHVGIQDLLALLGSWGDPGGPADVNRDGLVDVLDLLAVLSGWGPCA